MKRNTEGTFWHRLENSTRSCSHKIFTDGRDIFCSVQETTTRVYPKVHRGGVTQKWTKYVSSLRVERKDARLLCCSSLVEHCSTALLAPRIRTSFRSTIAKILCEQLLAFLSDILPKTLLAKYHEFRIGRIGRNYVAIALITFSFI